MPKRKLVETSEFPVGALIVTGPAAKKIWAAIEDEEEVAAGA